MSWTIISGTLPAGLTLNSDGTIAGTPAAPTTQAAIFIVNATIGEGASSVFSTQTLTITVTKSDTELGDLTVSGNTGIEEGAFQYGDIITVTFTPQPKQGGSTSITAHAEGSATLTYAPADGGEQVTLATANAQADGSFKLTYDTKEKRLPIGEDLTLTVSYGGSDELNPVEQTVTVTLDKAILMNVPSVSGNFVYGETLTVNYRKQDDETVTYQWYRSGEIISSATKASYTPTAEDIGKNILVEVIATDEWRGGRMRSTKRMVSKAPGGIEIACDSVAYGEAVRPIVSSTTNTGADVTFSYARTGGTSYGPSAAAPTAPGTYAVTATVAETATHTGATSEPVSFSIARPYVPPVSPSGPDWGDVADELAGAERGGRVVVDMDGETVLPGDVIEALASGAFAGNGDGSFSPSGELTREQAACVLHNRARAAGEEVSARADLSEFADAASVSAWAEDAMSWAVAEGVISGTGDGLLEPGRAITRSELCATLMNLELRG